jgi:hypothetical protein
MSNSPWYREGLKFQCTGCGNCCTGDPGHVWVSRAEVAALALAMEVDVLEFETQCVRRVGKRKSLIEVDRGDCVLFDPETRQCRTYEARPVQCRTWPFWDSTLETPADWEETCAACPGCGHGPISPLARIEAQRLAIRI